MSALLWIFSIFDAGALLVLVAELSSSRGLARPPPPPRLPAWGAIAVLIASYAAELSVTAYAALHQAQPPPHWFVPLPLTGPVTSNQNVVVAAMLLLAAIQTFALLQLYRGRPTQRGVAVGCAALVALSLLSPAMISADAYAYVADALLGRAAYAPPGIAFPSAFAPIDLWWKPLPPTPYGPLWLLVAWLVTAALPTLLGKILALRLLGVAAFVALPWLLRALGMPLRIVAIAALNPGLAFEYVASAHNDLFGVVLLIAAVLYARRRPLLGAVLLVAGGLVKLPFALLGLPAMSRTRSRTVRFAACIAVPAGALLLTWASGGGGFLSALQPHLTTSPFMRVLTGGVALVVTVAVVAAVFGARRLRAVVLLVPLAPAYSLAWYFAWGLPYAVARRNVTAYLLAAFPLVAVLLEVKFMTPWTLFGVVPAVFVWQAIAIREGSYPRRRST